MAAGRAFFRGPTLVAGLGLGLLALGALLAPWLAPADPDHIDILGRLGAPGLSHWLGTDALGRDVLSRIVYGARVSLAVGLTAALGSTVLGTLLGAISGYAGGWVDELMMRGADVLMCIPSLFLVLTLIVVLGPGIYNVVLVIILTGWTDIARLVRGEVLSLKQRDFVLAARASGATPARVLLRHVLPNAMAPVYVSLTFGIAGAIMMESGLSFLGLGVQPPTASWGSMLSEGRESLQEAWWLVVFPGLAILATMLLINQLGEAARRHFDPKGGL
jgi:peptide/nickel transport system permease protein